MSEVGGVAPADARPTRGARVGVAVAAGVLPLFSCFVSGVVAIGATGTRDTSYLVEEGGALAFAALAFAVLGAIVGGVLVGMGGALRVPSVIVIVLGCIPWITGIAAARVGIVQVVDAIAYADPAVRATILAQGISETISGRLIGGICSAGLLGGIALGLAVASLAPHAEKRSLLGALIGAGLAFFPLAVAGYAGAVASAASLPVFAASALALLACAVAGFGAGDDDHGRSAALAAATPVAALLAIAAAATAVPALSERQVFHALALVEPSERPAMLAFAATELEPAARIAWLAPLAAIPAVIGLAIWAASRRRPTPFAIVAGVALASWMVVPGLLDALASAGTEAELGAQMRTPWADITDFVPMPIERGSGDDPVAFLTPTRVHDATGDMPIVSGVRPIVLSRLEAWLAPRSDGEDLPDWLVEEEDVEEVGTARTVHIAIAIDARTPPALAAEMLGALQEGGVTHVTLVGGLSEPLPESLPITFRLVGRTAGDTSFSLRSSLARLDEDYVILAASVPGGLSARDGALVLRADAGETRDGHEEILFLPWPGDLRALVDASVAAENGHCSLVVGLPGESMPAPREPEPAGEVPRITLSDTPESDIGMPREIIQRVVRSHLAQIRFCYERALVRDPSLAGRVTVRFTIAADGSVSDAQVASSTLADVAVETCIADAVRRWTFPEPGGGAAVTVSYPFVFEPSP